MKVNLNNTDNNDYVRGYKDGKKAGATEWAETAQILVDALQLISQTKSFTNKKGFIKQIADNALAKYKEVTK